MNWCKTYAAYGITRVDEQSGYMRLALSHDCGTQRKGLLYFAKENPFKDVGHAWFEFDDRDVITGMAIEDDWVVLGKEEKEDEPNTQAKVLASITPPVEKKPEIKRAETVDLGIYGDLDHTRWEKHKEGAPHMGRAGKGYHMFKINGMKGDFKDGTVQVAVEQQGGENIIACPTMNHCKLNPFRSMTKAFLKIEQDEIVGVMTECDEWVSKK